MNALSLNDAQNNTIRVQIAQTIISCGGLNTSNTRHAIRLVSSKLHLGKDTVVEMPDGFLYQTLRRVSQELIDLGEDVINLTIPFNAPESLQ